MSPVTVVDALCIFVPQRFHGTLGPLACVHTRIERHALIGTFHTHNKKVLRKSDSYSNGQTFQYPRPCPCACSAPLGRKMTGLGTNRHGYGSKFQELFNGKYDLKAKKRVRYCAKCSLTPRHKARLGLSEGNDFTCTANTQKSHDSNRVLGYRLDDTERDSCGVS